MVKNCKLIARTVRDNDLWFSLNASAEHSAVWIKQFRSRSLSRETKACRKAAACSRLLINFIASYGCMLPPLPNAGRFNKVQVAPAHAVFGTKVNTICGSPWEFRPTTFRTVSLNPL